MLIAQITDLHLTRDGDRAQGLVDTDSQLEQILQSLSSLSARPDLVLITGDIADNNQFEAYTKLRDRMNATGIPYYLIPGNHDNPDMMRRVFPDHPGMKGLDNQFIQ